MSKYIFDNAQIDKKEFKKFRKNTLLYRNKNLIHREHAPEVVQDGWIKRPVTQEIARSAFTLYRLITSLASTFPASPSHQGKYQFNYCIFKNMTGLREYFLRSFMKDRI